MSIQRRRGFTFVELLVSVTIVALLAGIAVPKYQELKRQAMTARLIGDFTVVRNAAMNFALDSGYYPREAGTGKMPRNLKSYLPGTFSFSKQDWKLDYENVKIRPAPRTPREPIVGVSAKTTDKKLEQTAAQRLGPGTTLMYNGKLMYIISGF
ncbi:MAG: prepilin-type N-terminal cleavage/methylation domain-containing protein [Gemmatimonadaceae bacterium]